jgi:predicted Zn-ribbon and HTH transcriptional regulator
MTMLQASDVNCHLKDEHLATINPILSPAVGGMKLMVHPAHVEKAWDLIDSAEAQYLKNVPCPVCKSHKLTSVSVMRKHKCKLAAIASMVLNGHSVEITKYYQCGSCGYDFKELPKRY